MVRSGRVRAGRARSAGSGRSRRTAGPSTAGPGTGRAGSRPGARRTTARSAVPGSHSANARAARPPLERWPRIGRQQLRVADGDRPDTAGLGRVAVARAPPRPGRGTASRAGPPGAGTVVDRVRDAQRLAIERVDRVGELADGRRRPAGRRDVLERRPARCPTAAARTHRAAAAARSGSAAAPAGTIPSGAYSALRMGWALSVAVARNVASPSARHDPRRAARARRRRPGARAGRTASRGTTAARARTAEANATTRSSSGRVRRSRRDDEAFGIGRLEVGVQARCSGAVSGRDVGLVEAPDVVVDRRRARSRRRPRARRAGPAGTTAPRRRRAGPHGPRSSVTRRRLCRRRATRRRSRGAPARPA